MAAYDKDTVTDEQLAAAKAAALKYIQDYTAAQVAAGVKSTDKSARLPGETASAANARITQAYKDQEKPALTKEGEAAKATIEWVRQGAGGVGKYMEVYGVGTPIPETRTTTSGNVYDKEGNLVSGTGLKSSTGTGTGNRTVTITDSNTAKYPGNAIIAAGGSPAGFDKSGKEVFYKLENQNDVNFYYADGSKVPTDNLIGIKEAVDFANAGWSVQGLAKGQTPASVKYADIIKDAEARGPVKGSDAYMIGDVVVTRDFNGISLYDSNGNLISGRGSQYQVGIAGNSANKTSQINIAGVGAYGTPEYNINLAYKNPLKKSGSVGSTGTGSFTGGYTGGAPLGAGPSGMENPYTPGSAEYSNFNDRASAYNTLYNEFNKYGLGGLVEDIKGLIQSNISPSQFAIELQNTKAYQQRFKANQDRISKGLRALTPAEYIGLEDQYQNIMRNYGLPSSYYAKDTMGTQEGFQKFIANDVSAAELEDRVMMAQDRLISASPEIKKQLSGYYNISEGDILSYILDPQNALNQIKRKVQSAEVGAAAAGAGLDAALNRAEGLVAAGVTGKQYQEAAPFLKEASMRGSELGSFYGMTPYDQNAAEAEAFNLSGSAEAARKRKELTKREQAEFSGAAGTAQNAFDRGRQGSY